MQPPIKSTNAIICYRLSLSLVAVFFILFAFSNNIAHSINAFYFPNELNLVESWRTLCFVALAIVCLSEAIFAIIWQKIRRLKKY